MVIQLKKNKYSIQHLFTEKRSFDNIEYICKTCNSKLSKGQVPCQAVYNKLMVDEIPIELRCLQKLEQILIAQRIVFEKIIVMPKGQQRKIKGAICNVPVDCDQTCNVLPRSPEMSGIIMLKLKRKLAFRGHLYFQAVRPDVVLRALHWLKVNNPLYSEVTIDTEKNDRNLSELQLQPISENDSEVSSNSNVHSEQKATDKQNEEETEDPLDEFRTPTTETCLQSILPDYPVHLQCKGTLDSAGNEVFNIAPGENKHPVSFMTDKHCEELAFPVLFPKGRFGYTIERAVNLSPTKYFNARLLHYSGRFAMNPEYLFFAQFIIEQKKVSDSINIALSKVHGQHLTASHIRSNSESLQNLVCQDQAYLFLRQIPGTPLYWQQFMYEVVAMVKQLGIPTWFMTLSCADLRWPELFQIIARTQGLNLTDEQLEALSYNERCSMLNLNPVIVAKHFQFRVETFFTEILLTKANPIGKIVHYALRVEFQGFKANVDLQPIFNHYKCVTYVCSYFSKDETECSQAILNAAKEAKDSNLNIRDKLRKIGAAFLSTREVSSQECVYRCMPELWLRKVYPKTVFVSTGLPEKRVRVAKSQTGLDALDDDSTDIYKSNIIERYRMRPHTIPSVDSLCLAQFASYYYKEYSTNSETSDAQPEILTHDAIELYVQLDTNTDLSSQLPPRIKLINSNEIMKCRKIRAVVRYHTPNKTKEPENYFHHLLMLYYPWHK